MTASITEKSPEVAVVACESRGIDNVEAAPASYTADGERKPDYKFSIGWPHEPRIIHTKKYVCPGCRRIAIRAAICLVVLLLLISGIIAGIVVGAIMASRKHRR
jgi:hypothetical protein